MPTKTISIRLDEAIEEQIREEARKCEQSTGEWLREQGMKALHRIPEPETAAAPSTIQWPQVSRWVELQLRLSEERLRIELKAINDKLDRLALGDLAGALADEQSDCIEVIKRFLTTMDGNPHRIRTLQLLIEEKERELHRAQSTET
jgi:hypothetical protein